MLRNLWNTYWDLIVTAALLIAGIIAVTAGDIAAGAFAIIGAYGWNLARQRRQQLDRAREEIESMEQILNSRG